MTVLAGVDAGGTQSRALVSVAGDQAGEATGQGAGLRSDTILRSATTIAEVVRTALRAAGRPTADVLCAGVAGAGDPGLRNQLAGALRSEALAAKVVVTTDVEIALASAFADSGGIVLLAGTGSVAATRSEGTILTVGGLGWRMGDQGSGYAVGQAALLRIGRSHQGLDEATALTDLVLTRLRLPSVERLVRWSTTATPREVARLAQDVSQAALAGDQVAGEIIDRAAADLAELASALAGKSAGGNVPVALAGGLLQPGSAVRQRLVDLLDSDPRLTLSESEVDPARGAVILASQATNN